MGNHKGRQRCRTSEVAQKSPWRSVECNAGRNHRLTTELAGDHREILRQLDKLKTTPNLVEGIFKPTIICIRLHQLFAQHCAKEQYLLYPLLSRYLGSKVSKLLTQEHKEISNMMRKIVEHIRSDGKATHWEAMSQLDQLLCTHFSKEENVLFWYLDLQLVSLSS